MLTLISKIRENKFIRLIISVFIIIIIFPLIEILIKVIFSYGTLLGTHARRISEGMICLG